MSFLNEEQADLIKVVADFAKKEIAPNAAHYDETEEFPWDDIHKMAELGLMGMPVPESLGGAETDTVTYVAAIEEIAKADAAMGGIMAIHTSTGIMPILMNGTEEQKKKYIPDLATGKKVGAFALTEPNAGSDAAGVQTTAVLDGDEYVLNGSKCFISNGGEAEVYTVLASTDKSKGTKGISAFIVEKGTPGFTFGKKEHKLGIRASATRELVFQDCRIPKENLLGVEGKGFSGAMAVLDGARIGIASQAVGIAQAAYEAALEYSKVRIQFGKPIAKQQAISFMLADMAIQIEASRQLVRHAAELKDAGKPFAKEAAMAKTMASDTAVKVALDAVQVLGGYGYTREYPVERYLRDAKITQIYEGTNQIQRLVISRAILGRF
ncbi:MULTISPECIES: acyl-CoA dehydrogenase [unclassified Megasphaera]|uniref:acyl-CoA dehydrogenase n=1 Tax=unclassified Megasphaera TaxID=2626256 RepID=UPI00073E7A54|nr:MULTISPECIES: acyl-CoA dehydrogenase [unclassified Megasphaera]KUH56646.1 acyl-CoA dehydrogenase [Megasphaera sp. DJF_B143]MCI5531678.1 acyl-CoA dehydrogenase [Caecibacter massiliensis]HAM04359.1 acyl-CoA dehydrogenase [Megasphaera sp.]